MSKVISSVEAWTLGYAGVGKKVADRQESRKDGVNSLGKLFLAGEHAVEQAIRDQKDQLLSAGRETFGIGVDLSFEIHFERWQLGKTNPVQSITYQFRKSTDVRNAPALQTHDLYEGMSVYPDQKRAAGFGIRGVRLEHHQANWLSIKLGFEDASSSEITSLEIGAKPHNKATFEMPEHTFLEALKSGGYVDSLAFVERLAQCAEMNSRAESVIKRHRVAVKTMKAALG